MATTSLILNIILLLWVLVLSGQIKKLTKDVSDLGRWSAYLENILKDAKILIYNSKKSENGVNEKLINLLK